MPAQPGGGFLIAQVPPEAVFTPEDCSEFHRQMAGTVRAFVQRAVLPALPAMEAGDFSHNVRLMRQAGELGLLGAEIPAEFGGLGLDKVTGAVVMENLFPAASFSITFGNHTGIGTLPILFYGTRAQKETYLPRLASGECIAAYALTEAGSGSDALGARTTARLSPDGRHWLLNGTKQWITNSAFAGVYTVYAKVNGEHFSAFLVDHDTPGLTTGSEEHKLGIHGSSTRSVYLADAPVPVANLLYQVGRGHHIAFNVLNIGRFKLGTGAMGGSKYVLGLAARFARERQQFRRPLAAFPLIQQKLAEMAVRTYAAESVSYRTAGLLDARLGAVDYTAHDPAESSRALGEYAVECSITKVLGTEVLDFVVDEALQIHGGYGYMEEYPVCRAYRDSRINRIFEGTNEVNRLVISSELLRRGARGQLALLPALAGPAPDLPPVPGGALGQELGLLAAAQRLTLLVAGQGVHKYQGAVEQEQEFLAGVADLCLETFAMESCLLRALKHQSDARADLAAAYAHDAFGRMAATAGVLLARVGDGGWPEALYRLTRREPVDTIDLRRRIAARVTAAGGYPLG